MPPPIPPGCAKRHPANRASREQGRSSNRSGSQAAFRERVDCRSCAAVRHNFGNPRALEMRPDFPIDSMTDLVLGLPGLLGGVLRSQVEWAEALAPTTIILWIGSNDALGAVLAA